LGRRAEERGVDHHHLFIGGLHRSGTTLFRDLLTAHPKVSAFERTGVIQDEGQFLQKVYLRERKLGGPGRFAFHPGAHLTEDSKLVSEASRQRLVSSWSRYWDLTRPLLVEKTPSNMLKSRFLQSLFPDSMFIILVRHPVASTLATVKWHKRKVSSDRLLDHWFRAHDLLRMDSLYINRLLVVRYEDLILGPQRILSEVAKFLGLEPGFGTTDHIDPSRTDRYRIEWDRMRAADPGLMQRYERKANLYGYTLDDMAVPIGDFPVEKSKTLR
jgi:hypothetical protein